MELDENLKAKIAALNEDQLRAGILAVARQMGVEDKKAASRLGDMKKVKKTLENLTQKDLDRISNRIGKDKAEEWMAAVKKEAMKK